MNSEKMAHERFHDRGRFMIRTEWRGNVLCYDVLTKSGQVIAAGLDALSHDEETALEGITDRLFKRGNAVKGLE